MRRLTLLLSLLTLLLVGCVASPPSPAPILEPAPLPSAQTATPLPPSPGDAGLSTEVAPSATAALASQPEPSLSSPEAPGLHRDEVSQAAIEPGWAVYEAALRPGSAQGLDLAGMTQYSLTVSLAPDLTGLSGAEAITYTNREQVRLDTIYLHLFPNLWDGGMTVTDVAEAGRPVTVTLPSGDDIAGVPMAEPLLPGQSVTISLRFSIPVPVGNKVGNYGEFQYSEGILALAHFYPTVVVYDEKGWHLETPASQGDVIYHDASLYDVTLTAPADLAVVATGATLGRTTSPDGSAIWHLAGGPMRDFNIVASARYESMTQQAGEVAINCYFLTGDLVGAAKILQWAAHSVQTFEATFGPYPYRELDLVPTDTSAFGIEYPGLIVLADQLYKLSNQDVLIESVTVHEVAHQWWYNVVGNDQVNAPWLDESMAQFSTYLYARKEYGQEGSQGFVDAMNLRWSQARYIEKPIGLPVSAYNGVEYSAIVYGRGPLFLLALRDRMGEQAMAEFLRRYYEAYTWRIATPADFKALAESVGGQNLDELFREWVLPN